MPKFDLPDELDSLDGIDEKDRSFYVEKADGKGFEFKHPHAAISTLRNVKQERQQMADKIKSLEAQANAVKDIDPEEYRSLKAKKKELEEASAQLPEEIEKVKRELKTTSEAKIAEERSQREKIQKRAEKRERDSAIRDALSDAGVTEAGKTALARLLGSELTIEWDGEEPVVKIYDDKGKVRLNKEADPMTVSDLVGNYRKDFPAFFKSQAGNGSGSNSRDGDIDINPESDPANWTIAEKSAARKKLGESGYRALVAKHAQKNDEARRANQQGKRR